MPTNIFMLVARKSIIHYSLLEYNVNEDFRGWLRFYTTATQGEWSPTDFLKSTIMFVKGERAPCSHKVSESRNLKGIWKGDQLSLFAFYTWGTEAKRGDLICPKSSSRLLAKAKHRSLTPRPVLYPISNTASISVILLFNDILHSLPQKDPAMTSAGNTHLQNLNINFLKPPNC